MTVQKKLLIVDDEQDICELIRDALSPEYQISIAHDGATGLKLATQIQPDLVLVDLRMPRLDGIGFCKALREIPGFSKTLLMVMTGQEEAEVRSFESGADDFIVKPFGTEELRARIRARLRRQDMEETPPHPEGDGVISAGNLQLDLSRYEARIDDRLLVLSALEFKLLSYFARTDGKIVSRTEVLEANWPDVVVTDRTVDTHVSKLRRALAGSQFQIQTVYGAGYCWKKS
jgi:DNA-binding response OmpR family regulator